MNYTSKDEDEIHMKLHVVCDPRLIYFQFDTFLNTRSVVKCSVQPITTFKRAFLEWNHVFHVNFKVTRDMSV